MTEIEKIQSKILMRMQEVLDNEQLQKLENVLDVYKRQVRRWADE